MPKRPLPRAGQPGEVYLLHLHEPVGHARHYIGWALDTEARNKVHHSGNGGRLLRAARNRGIGWDIARIWEPADRRFERRLKNTSNARLLCPICNPDHWKTQIPEVSEPRPATRKQLIAQRRK